MPTPTSLVKLSDYREYLYRAQVWASDPSWNTTPDTVELALFRHGYRVLQRSRWETPTRSQIDTDHDVVQLAIEHDEDAK